MNKPRVSVLMSVFNGENFLCESIESILSQTFEDFEFLIIDDASTDNSSNIIKNYNDTRIKYYKNTQNLKLAKSLNILIDNAQGEYLVRMDADDISTPNRIDIQVKFMDQHKEIGMSGAGRIVYENNDSKKYNAYDSFNVNKDLLEENCIAHPTVIIRKELLDKFNLRYNENYKSAQDYELWVRMTNFFPIGNISNIVLIYRHHENQTRVLKANEQAFFTLLIENKKIIKDILIRKKLKNNVKPLLINMLKIIKNRVNILKK